MSEHVATRKPGLLHHIIKPGKYLNFQHTAGKTFGMFISIRDDQDFGFTCVGKQNCAHSTTNVNKHAVGCSR